MMTDLLYQTESYLREFELSCWQRTRQPRRFYSTGPLFTQAEGDNLPTRG